MLNLRGKKMIVGVELVKRKFYTLLN